MIDYPKMYALLCGAIDDVLDELYNIPETVAIAEKLTTRYSKRRKYTFKLHNKMAFIRLTNEAN